MDLNPVGIHFQRRQARHICSIQNQTMFQAPSGAEYAAPLAAPKSDEGGTGLACRAVVGRRRGNLVARVATKISLLTELGKSGGGPPQSKTLARYTMFPKARSVLECASHLAPWVQRRKVNNQKPVGGCRESKPPSGNHTKEQFVTVALTGVSRMMSFLISSSRY
jgi:hypothetical protein